MPQQAGNGGVPVPPPVAPIVLPALAWEPTQACSSRNGAKVQVIPVHRWGAPYKSIPAEALSYQGVISWFKDPANQVSAHIVHPGSAVPGEATQMVDYATKAWAESFYNPISVEIESADAIWLGHDPRGMQVLAREVAFLLRHFELAPRWVSASDIAVGKTGFCRHADLGSAGGGHLACPTTDLHVWAIFVAMVKHEYARGGFRPAWGR